MTDFTLPYGTFSQEQVMTAFRAWEALLPHQKDAFPLQRWLQRSLEAPVADPEAEEGEIPDSPWDFLTPPRRRPGAEDPPE